MCVSFEPMRDYAGFGYASLDLVCLIGFGSVSYEPMRDYAGFGYASLLFRWIWLCFVCLCCFGYVLIFGYVIVLYEEYYII